MPYLLCVWSWIREGLDDCTLVKTIKEHLAQNTILKLSSEQKMHGEATVSQTELEPSSFIQSDKEGAVRGKEGPTTLEKCLL